MQAFNGIGVAPQSQMEVRFSVEEGGEVLTHVIVGTMRFVFSDAELQRINGERARFTRQSTGPERAAA